MSTFRTAEKAPSASVPKRETLKEFHEEVKLGKAYDVKLAARTLPFLKPHRFLVYTSMVLLVVLASLSLLRPLLMGRVANAASMNRSDLLTSAVLLSLVIVGTQLLSFGQNYAMQVAGARAMADLRAHVFAFLQRLSLRYLDKTPLGRLTTRATSDIDAMGELFASGVLTAFGDILSLTVIVTAMLVIDYQLALFAFASLPVVWLLVNFVRKRSRVAFREIRTKTARLNAFLSEQVSGIGVVQAYAREAAMADEFEVYNRGYLDANKSSILYESILDAALEMVATLCIASVLFWCGITVASGRPTSFAKIVMFTQFVRQFFEPVSLLAQRYTLLQSAMAGAERVFQLLDMKDVEGADDAAAEAQGAKPATDAGEVALAFDNVHFAYREGQPILRGVSFSVKRGERIAIVGSTGAGKTTVSSLLLRLYEIDQGKIAVLGNDLRSYSRADLRAKFSLVGQDVFLFTGTILSNIAVGHEVDEARAAEALRQVGGASMLEERGISALVEERGSNFSVGEKQIIAFARALYRDAPILILDEATASVDSDTEAKLQLATDAVMRSRTCLVIAHRLSTIESADRILVFAQGEIAESGTHRELLALGGVYAALHHARPTKDTLLSS
jgi:ATP-binding cassette, subfamily B, multidrug efflux pump